MEQGFGADGNVWTGRLAFRALLFALPCHIFPSYLGFLGNLVLFVQAWRTHTAFMPRILMTLSNDLERKFRLLVALHQLDEPSRNDLEIATKIPVSTLKKLIPVIREEFGVDIRFMRHHLGARGAAGHYEIKGWGILNEKEFLALYGEALAPSSTD